MPFEFPHTQSKKNIAVIGAGISGMGAAHLLAKSHNVTLYEAEKRIGLGTFAISSNPRNIDNNKTNPNKIYISIMQTSHS